MKILLVFCLLYSPLFARASMPVLTSADGKQTMQARPVATEGSSIHFIKENGKKFKASPESFSVKDQKNLRAWVSAMQKDPHAALINRVAKAKTLRVLFIGNSYSFHIPEVFERLATSEGKSIVVEQITHGGWRLSKHAKSQETLDKIAQRKWDVVVLQEQSLVPAFPEAQRSRDMDQPAKKLVDAVRSSGAIPVFFLTWGRRDGDKINSVVFPNDSYEAMQKRLVAGYQAAAKYTGGTHIIPVGEVWATLRERNKDNGLYSNDGSHPAQRGNYLAACVFYSAFYNEKVQKNAPNINDSQSVRNASAMSIFTALPYPLTP